MNTNCLFRLPLRGLFCLSLLTGCSAAPATDSTADALDAGAPREELPAGDVGHDDIVRGPILCESAICNSSCSEQPGVAGGSCEGTLCICDAPTCGAFDQTPCAGNYCSQGHYDAWLNLCDGCGMQTATCCDYEHPGATTSCYGGLYCQNGYNCQSCGRQGQQACQPAPDQGDPFCDSGLVPAVAGPNDTICATSCGNVGQLPCLSGGSNGCTQEDTVLISGKCQFDPSCGSFGQGCCGQGNYFQSHGSCWDGTSCDYLGFPGFGSSWCCAVLITGNLSCGSDSPDP
jgi:hypothetical protein